MGKMLHCVVWVLHLLSVHTGHGLERQAQSIFEDDRTKNITQFISNECKQYVTYNKLKYAKTLLEATNGVYCDRHVIYATILDICIKTNKAKEALKLWCEYSTEDKMITKPLFKTKLIKLLKADKMGIPFDLEQARDSNESNADTNPPNKN